MAHPWPTLNSPKTFWYMSDAITCDWRFGYPASKTQIASNVHVLSGGHQHTRDELGNITGSEEGSFDEITIGPNCWIGTSAIVMADVGEGSTIGAGSVVTKEIPPKVVAVGNPARVIKDA